jgi:hypothetical protein
MADRLIALAKFKAIRSGRLEVEVEFDMTDIVPNGEVSWARVA